MSTEKNKDLICRAFKEVYNQGNFDAVDEIYDKDFKSYTPPDMLKGPESVKQYASMLRSAFPDLNLTIEDQIAEGDKVVTRFSIAGTHKGEYMGIVPTNKFITGTGITIHRIANGKAVESWDNFDALGMMQQMGAISN
jgi:steroid delta-isomerase-like uncharacterized protein